MQLVHYLQTENLSVTKATISDWKRISANSLTSFLNFAFTHLNLNLVPSGGVDKQREGFSLCLCVSSGGV